LKKCPSCDAINQDYDYDCGVCGATLSGVVSKDSAIIEAETPAKPPPRLKIQLRGLALLAIGLAAMGMGFYLFFESGPIGLLLLLIGVPTIAYILGIDGSAPSFRGSFSGKSAMVRREIEEDVALEKREKGEDD